ncbi:MAG: hypothetical protein ONB47_20395 [candidate division KSB1 bacterium]|nr:hypothetical protein [candidate division KSB1 bacterium]
MAERLCFAKPCGLAALRVLAFGFYRFAKVGSIGQEVCTTFSSGWMLRTAWQVAPKIIATAWIL